MSIVGSDLLPPVLKTIKNLTMLPSALEVLQHANAIEALVQVLADYQIDGKIAAVSFVARSFVPVSSDHRCQFAGDPKSHCQRPFQPLPPEQESSRGSSYCRSDSSPPEHRPGTEFITTQTIRSSDPVRLCSCEQDLSKVVVSCSLARFEVSSLSSDHSISGGGTMVSTFIWGFSKILFSRYPLSKLFWPGEFLLRHLFQDSSLMKQIQAPRRNRASGGLFACTVSSRIALACLLQDEDDFF